MPGKRVVVVVSLQRVVEIGSGHACQGDQGVGTALAVRGCTEVEVCAHCRSCVCIDRVACAARAVQGVAASASREFVHARAAFQAVVSGITAESVIAGATQYGVVTVPTAQKEVVASCAVQRVVAAVAEQLIAAFGAAHRVSQCCAREAQCLNADEGVCAVVAVSKDERCVTAHRNGREVDVDPSGQARQIAVEVTC